jgi:hypothetical protein
MWEPRRLTTLWASTACYRDNFTFTTSWKHRNCIWATIRVSVGLLCPQMNSSTLKVVPIAFLAFSSLEDNLSGRLFFLQSFWAMQCFHIYGRLWHRVVGSVDTYAEEHSRVLYGRVDSIIREIFRAPCSFLKWFKCWPLHVLLTLHNSLQWTVHVITLYNFIFYWAIVSFPTSAGTEQCSFLLLEKIFATVLNDR